MIDYYAVLNRICDHHLMSQDDAFRIYTMILSVLCEECNGGGCLDCNNEGSGTIRLEDAITGAKMALWNIFPRYINDTVIYTIVCPRRMTRTCIDSLELLDGKITCLVSRDIVKYAEQLDAAMVMNTMIRAGKDILRLYDDV